MKIRRWFVTLPQHISIGYKNGFYKAMTTRFLNGSSLAVIF